MAKKPRILNLAETYTFSRYFELPFTPADILADLDCSFKRSLLQLPQYAGELVSLPFLQQYLQRNLARVNPINEAARREVLIAPTLLEVSEEADAQMNIEYPIVVSNLLRGTLDYYLTAPQSLLVVEAKQADLSRGFTQLAVELIALDQWTDLTTPTLHGVVTTGEDWRFGVFHREARCIVQDIELYRVPEGLEKLLRTLVAILKFIP